MAEGTWSKIEGMIIAGSLDPLALAEEFKKSGIVASLVWYDATPELVGVNVAAQDDQLATLSKRGKVFKAGPSVEFFANAIAEKFAAEVMLGDVQVDKFVAPEGEEAEDDVEALEGVDPREHDHDKAEALPIRVVEISATPSSAIPLLAAFEGVDVAELPHDETRRVLLAQVPAHRSGWHFGDPPLVRLTLQGDEFHAHLMPEDDPESTITYNWGMNEIVIAGAKGWDGEIPVEVQNLVGGRAEITAIHDAVPGVDVEAAFEASKMRGSAAITRFIRALGLDPQAAEFLLGWLTLEQVTGAKVHHARGISNAIGRSVDILLDERSGETKFWDTYTNIVREKPWLIPAIAVGEITAATALLIAGRKREGLRTTGGKVATGAAILLLVDALADTTLARLTARRLDRHEARDN
ncbi:hypothetical protein [Actinomyces minihominis]|uniref:hypothetical protein n=1 Tax=Actinomyces minihominis TaxID=2002838 RepID=UPI000C0720BD|nr:hypothetical protein [Actinomyces minihominis]